MKKSNYITREELTTFKTELVGEIKVAIAEAMKAHTPKSARGTATAPTPEKKVYESVGFTSRGKVATAKARLLKPVWNEAHAKATAVNGVVETKDGKFKATFLNAAQAKVFVEAIMEWQATKAQKVVDKHYASKQAKTRK